MFLLNSGFLPNVVPDDHHTHYSMRGFHFPKLRAITLEWSDVAFLQDYGFYMDAIWNHAVTPANRVQSQFRSNHNPADATVAKLRQIWFEVCRAQMFEKGELSLRCPVYDASQSWVPYRATKSDWRRGLGA